MKDVENPMVIDPAPKLRGVRYEEGNWDDQNEPERLSYVSLEIDISNLTEEEANLFVGVFEDIQLRYFRKKEWDFCEPFNGWLDIDDGGDFLIVKGRVTDEDYTLIEDTLFEMRDKVEVSEWQ